MYSGLIAVGLVVTFAWIQAGAGGSRLAHSLLPYGLLGLLCLGGVFAWRKLDTRPSLACIIAALVFACYIVGRALTSPVPYLARSDLFGILAVLAVYLLTAYYLNPRHRLWVAYGLLTLGLAQAVLGTIQFFAQPDLILFGFQRAGGTLTRASGMYINSNHAAWMFAACAVLGLALTIRRNLHTEARLLTGGLSAAALFGLILTISRGGYLAAGAGLSVVLVGSLLSLRVRSVDRFVRMGLSALLALALVGVAVFYALKSNAWHDERWARLAEGLAVNARLPIWESAIEQFKLSPAFGTGARTFYYYGRRLRVEGGTQTDHVWAHNDYLDLLAGYGVIGIGLLAVVIAVHLWQPVRSFYRAGERAAGPSVMCSNSSALMLGALAIAAVNLVHSVVDFNMHIPANALIMCWALGILANPGVRPAPMRTPPRGWLHAPALVAVPVVGFLLIGIAGLYYRPEYFNEKARVAQRDGRYDQELAYAEEGLKYDAANPVLYRHAGSGRFHNASVIRDPMVRRTQDFEAARSLEAALALFPYDYETWLHYARALDRGMRPVEAERAYLKAIEENPRLAQAHAAYANFLWRGARWQDAIERMLLARRYRIPLSD